MIDLSDPRYLTAYDALCKELAAFEPTLPDKPQVIIGTHLDEPDAPAHLEELKAKYPDHQVIGICAFLEEGIADVRKAFIHLVSLSGKKPDDASSFTARVDKDAEYRQEP